jgi:hypothetical protein
MNMPKQAQPVLRDTSKVSCFVSKQQLLPQATGKPEGWGCKIENDEAWCCKGNKIAMEKSNKCHHSDSKIVLPILGATTEEYEAFHFK